MKKTLLSAFIFATANLLLQTFSFAQSGAWTQKANFGGAVRYGAASFSINGKGYVGTGDVALLKDFWEYDPATNIWTQKADFGGTGRNNAVGFSSPYGNGYIGTGYDADSARSDIWKYDVNNNAWTQVGYFPGGARQQAVCISVSGSQYCYLGTGRGTTIYSDFWRYDTQTDNWLQYGNFGGGARYGATGFNIGTTIYIGTGFDGSSDRKDFWAWTASGGWIQKANFGGTARDGAVGFGIIGINKGYVGLGSNQPNAKDFWQYDAISDAWSQVANFGGAGRAYAIAFSPNSYGYVGTGANGASYTNDLWKFAPCSNFSITATSTNATCVGANNGSAAVTTTGGDTPYSYLWSTTQTTTAVSNLIAGVYTITVTDASGCTSSKRDTVKATPTPTVSICEVTVDSVFAKNNIIYWDKTSYTHAVDSFIVYRYDAISTNYLRIGAVPFDSLSMFTDTCFSIGGPNGGNPKYSSWKYKLAVRDTCGNLSAKSACVQSIFITASGPNFQWAPGYIDSANINVVTGYSFKRDNYNTGNWTVLANVGPTSTSTTDPNYASYPNGNWRVDALGLNCTPTLIHPKDPSALAATVKTSHSNSYRTYAVLTVSVSVTNATSCSANDGSIHATASGGLAPYTYLWNPTAQITQTATGLSIGTYTLIVTDANSTTFSITATVSCLNGVNESQLENSVSVYPNPTTGKFQVSSSMYQVKELEVYNLYGEKIYQAAVNRKQETINLSAASGIYFLKVITDKGTLNKKIIIQ